MARVLIVEDEAIIAMDLTHQLRRLGHTVVGVAHTGEVAIEMATQRAPEVILMDVRLQGKLDGIETATHILAQMEVPIIYLSAFTDEATLRRMRQTRHVRHLAKPVLPDLIQQAIQDALRRGP